MRLFIAIDFDQKTSDRLLRVQESIRRQGGRGNFSRRENLHVTLEFLGEYEPDDVLTICSLIDTIRAESFPLTFDTLGRFTRKGRDIWWVGIADNPRLIEIQHTLRTLLRSHGFRVDSRRYQPHVTVARDVRISAEEARSLLQTPFEPICTTISQIHLMESTRIEGKLMYPQLHTHPLEPSR